MKNAFPRNITTAQQATFAKLAKYLHSTSQLELGYSLTRQGDATTPRNIWPVTCPLCDPSSHLNNDTHGFDQHMPKKLKTIRYCPRRKIKNDRLTYGDSQLDNTENMINAHALYDHIRLYPDKCFMYACFELILDTLYPVMQRQMRKWCNPTNMTFPSLVHPSTERPRQRPGAIDVDVADD